MVDGDHHVEGPFDQPRRASQAVAPDSQQRQSFDVVELDGRADRLEETWDNAHLRPQRLDRPDRVQNLVSIATVGGNDHPVHSLSCHDLRQLAPLSQYRQGSPFGNLLVKRHSTYQLDLQCRVGLELLRNRDPDRIVADNDAPLGVREPPSQQPGAHSRHKHPSESKQPDRHGLITSKGPVDHAIAGDPDQEDVERRYL